MKVFLTISVILIVLVALVLTVLMSLPSDTLRRLVARFRD